MSPSNGAPLSQPSHSERWSEAQGEEPAVGPEVTGRDFERWRTAHPFGVRGGAEGTVDGWTTLDHRYRLALGHETAWG